MGQKAQVGGPACRYGVMDPDVSAAPRCPTCGTGIQPHWDWCHFCGYDPDHLKPWDWRPAGSLMGGSVQTATAPGKVGLIDLTDRKRKTKKAERAKLLLRLSCLRRKRITLRW